MQNKGCNIRKKKKTRMECICKPFPHRILNAFPEVQISLFGENGNTDKVEEKQEESFPKSEENISFKGSS